MAVATMAGARRVAFDEPFRAAWEHGNQFLVTAAAAFMSAAFSMQHDVLPIWVAVPLAVGFEWTYLRGLATADKTTNERWAVALNWSAMITSLVYGVLYVLGHYKIIPEQPGGWAAFCLAMAHVFPMTVLSFCAANLRRVQKLEERNRNRAQLALEEERNRNLQEERDRITLETERKKAEIEMWKEASIAKAQLKKELAQLAPQVAPATDPQPTKAAVIIDGVEYPSIQAAADAHGITRQAMSKRLAKERAS